MTPYELAERIKQIIAAKCACPDAWIQHPDPVSYQELTNIRHEIERFMNVELGKAAEAWAKKEGCA